MTKYGTIGIGSSPVPPTTLFPIYINYLIPLTGPVVPSMVTFLGVFLVLGVQVTALRPHNTKFLSGKYIS